MWIFREGSHGQNQRAILLNKKKKKKKKDKNKEKILFSRAAPLLCEEIKYSVCGFPFVYSFNKFSIYFHVISF